MVTRPRPRPGPRAAWSASPTGWHESHIIYHKRYRATTISRRLCRNQTVRSSRTRILLLPLLHDHGHILLSPRKMAQHPGVLSWPYEESYRCLHVVVDGTSAYYISQEMFTGAERGNHIRQATLDRVSPCCHRFPTFFPPCPSSPRLGRGPRYIFASQFFVPPGLPWSE